MSTTSSTPTPTPKQPEVNIFGPKITPKTAVASTGINIFNPPAFMIAAKISSLFNNHTDSDITIVTSSGSSYPAHLVILNLHTQFFSQALSSKYNFSEASSKSVTFPEHPPAAVYSTLEFCYRGTYTDNVPGEVPADTPSTSVTSTTNSNKVKLHLARHHFHVYLLADFLMISELQLAANEKFRQVMIEFPALPEEPVEAWMKTFPALAEEVYGNTDVKKTAEVALRWVIVKAAFTALGRGWNEGMLEEALGCSEFLRDLVKCQVAELRRKGKGKEETEEKVVNQRPVPTFLFGPPKKF